MSLGSLWAPFGHPLCSLWAPLRSLWPLLGGSWGTLGALWDHFEPPEGYLEGLWWLFWVCWGYFGQCFGMLDVFFIYFRNVVVLLTTSCYQKGHKSCQGRRQCSAHQYNILISYIYFSYLAILGTGIAPLGLLAYSRFSETVK